jgi:hypothetical protein
MRLLENSERASIITCRSLSKRVNGSSSEECCTNKKNLGRKNYQDFSKQSKCLFELSGAFHRGTAVGVESLGVDTGRVGI